MRAVPHARTGYDPRTFRKRHRSRTAASTPCVTGSSRWPSKSTKKTYSHGRRRVGRDSILVRLSRAARERLQDPVERADLVADREEDRGLVPPRPAGRATPHREEARHVVRVVLDALAEGRDAVEVPGQLAGHRRRRRRRATACSTAVDVDWISTTSASGRLRPSQPRHWASAWGWEKTRFTSASSAARESRLWWISSDASPQMRSSESISPSRVWFTTPSLEFSIGTTPTSARPRSTSSKTSGNAAHRQELRARAEVPERGHVRVGPLGAEVGDAERALEAAGRRQDLRPDRADRAPGQAARGSGGRAPRGSPARARGRGPARPSRAWRGRSRARAPRAG